MHIYARSGRHLYTIVLISDILGYGNKGAIDNINHLDHMMVRSSWDPTGIPWDPIRTIRCNYEAQSVK